VERRRPRLRCGANDSTTRQPRAAALQNLHAQMSTRYKRNLPHIEKDGASYFVTFRTRGGFAIPEAARSIVFDHCLHENNLTVHMHAFVVMPNHVHLLFTPLIDASGAPYPLAQTMKGIKGSSSHSVNKLLSRRGTLWEPESFDRIIRSDADFEAKMIYIIGNPMAAGLAKGPEDYQWLWRETVIA
jgi:REP-associated tyrosine transposase